MENLRNFENVGYLDVGHLERLIHRPHKLANLFRGKAAIVMGDI